ncbi:ABC transporter C-terminal domain-containing protein, partial [Alphaproteobacteria bacterium]|nr:ABC transporter C-terminal domain-containing protein [Alphaproteobacteria bacterium]
ERLTFKEKFLLKTLPEEIEAIEKKISLIDSKLSDMTFFNEQPEAYQQYAREAEALRQTMTDKEQNWLELELRRETLGEDI